MVGQCISVKMIADSCPKLQSLDISWRHITDESICIISRSCLKIEKLNFEGCNITDISINAISNLCNLQNAIRTLQSKNPSLDIVGWYSDANSESGISL